MQKLDIKFEDDDRIYLSSPLLKQVFVGSTEKTGTSETDFIREKVSYNRYGNPTKTRMEIRFGNDDRVKPIYVYVDYLRAPQYISITQEQIDDNEDNSQLLEFSDYVCYEIVNCLVRLIMENTSNPRLPNTDSVNNSIASPVSK